MLDPLYKHYQNLSNLPITYLVAEEARCSNKVRYSKDFGFNSLRHAKVRPTALPMWLKEPSGQM